LHMEGHSSDIDDPALGSKKRALLIEEPAPTLEEPPMVIEACKTVKGRSVLCVRDTSLPSLRSFVWRVPTLPA